MSLFRMSLPRQLQDDQPEYNQKLNRSSSQDASSEMDGNMVSVVNDTNVSDSSEMVSDAKDYSVDILQNFQVLVDHFTNNADNNNVLSFYLLVGNDDSRTFDLCIC
jgi:hypothetical protein